MSLTSESTPQPQINQDNYQISTSQKSHELLQTSLSTPKAEHNVRFQTSTGHIVPPA